MVIQGVKKTIIIRLGGGGWWVNMDMSCGC